MPFNKETDAHLTVSKKHRDMLRDIAREQRRDMRPALELMIEDVHGGAMVPPDLYAPPKRSYAGDGKKVLGLHD
jgi:hypothetical protein